MSQPKTYAGSCHCAAVTFEVTADLDQELVTCNCSICSRTGAIMAFTPRQAFTLKSGQASLTDYQFATKRVHHVFCSVCGVRAFSFGDGPDGSLMYVVNVRCLDGVTLSALKTKEFDGRSL
ncbi:MAG: GFA family protein [Myxococcales bacterium]|nr:GFA family protein [Myxococcales bacterium]